MKKELVMSIILKPLNNKFSWLSFLNFVLFQWSFCRLLKINMGPKPIYKFIFEPPLSAWVPYVPTEYNLEIVPDKKEKFKKGK